MGKKPVRITLAITALEAVIMGEEKTDATTAVHRHCSVAVCGKCDLYPCRCGEWISVYRIDSHYLGAGPLHRTREDAEFERRDLLRDDPKDKIRIVMNKMKAEEYADLSEHPGY